MKNGGSGRAKRKSTLEKKNTGRIIVATKSFESMGVEIFYFKRISLLLSKF
jgi:hypothetical protein